MRIKAGILILLSTIILLANSVVSQNISLGLPLGHNAVINNADWSPDGNYIVTASRDNTIKIWDASAGLLLRSIEGHTAWVEKVIWSPNGNKILSVSRDNTAKIWNPSDGKLIFSLEAHGDFVTNASWSPDGTKLVTASADGNAIIWDSESGKRIHVLSGHQGNVSSAEWSHNSKYIITASFDKTAKIWDAESGKLISNLDAHNDALWYAQWSPDNSKVLTASWDACVRIWEAPSGKLLHNLCEHTGVVNSAKWSPCGQKIISSSNDQTAIIWNAEDGKLQHKLQDHSDRVVSPTWSPDGKNVLTASWDNTVIIYDAEAGKQIKKLLGHNWSITNAQWSPDGTKIVSSSWDETAIIWDAVTGKQNHRLMGYSYVVNSAEISPDEKKILITLRNNYVLVLDAQNGRTIFNLRGHIKNISKAFWTHDGKKIITTSYDNTTKIWDSENGRLLHTLNGHNQGVIDASVSPDGNKIVTASRDSTAIVWDLHTGKKLKQLNEHKGGINFAVWSPDGKHIFTASEQDSSVVIWDAETNLPKYKIPSTNYVEFAALWSPNASSILIAKPDFSVEIYNIENETRIHQLRGHTDRVWAAEWTKDGKTIITASRNGELIFWDAFSGRKRESIKAHKGSICNMCLSPDNTKLTTSSWDKTAKVWNTNSGNLENQLSAHLDWVYSANWCPRSSEIITASKDGSIAIWDAKTKKLKIRQFIFEGNETLIMCENNLFDASEGAMERMYWVQGLNYIEFNQIKERYWEPNLWSKIYGGETTRQVENFNEGLPLYPKVENLIVSEKEISFSLVDQGGGIGKYIVLINGKEAFTGNEPAKDENFSGKKQELSFNYENHPYLIPGEENSINVRAFNADNFVSSRGVVAFSSRGGEDILQPNIFIVCCGVSDYTGDKIDLKYAAKDANDVCFSLTKGANKLFGKEHTNVFLLNTDMEEKYYPTKQNILNTFDEIAKKSVSSDIIVVYLAGHGINLGGHNGDFFFLTQEAYANTPLAYEDPVMRETSALSTEELVGFFRKSAATKQVLMIDACASGQLVEDLISSRDISSGTIRALDRMRDRTGMYILTGSAADAVSYEASKFGQGLLTYSIIEGIRGAALREGQLIDVDMLFQYSRDRVPNLARDIGGIQVPKVFSPYGAASFDLGYLTEQDKAEIPLAKEKPVFVMSVLAEATSFDDILGLEKMLDEKLRSVSARGASASFIFFDTRSFPEAYRIRGQYDIKGDDINVRINIFFANETERRYYLELSGNKNNLQSLTNEIVKQVEKFIK
jgi:WD40 repeat protein